MVGQRTWGTKMKYSFEADSAFAERIFKEIKSKDLVELDTIYKDSCQYLILSVSKRKLSLKALPLANYQKSFDSKSTIPTLDIPIYMIKSFKKIDKSNLLFLINQDNPHILNAIKDMEKI